VDAICEFLVGLAKEGKKKGQFLIWDVFNLVYQPPGIACIIITIVQPRISVLLKCNFREGDPTSSSFIVSKRDKIQKDQLGPSATIPLGNILSRRALCLGN
jgi:hypothetical protein